MSVLLPTILLPVAGVLALVLAWPRLGPQRSTGRLTGEAFGLGLVAVAIVQGAWALLWLIEQRW